MQSKTSLHYSGCYFVSVTINYFALSQMRNSIASGKNNEEVLFLYLPQKKREEKRAEILQP